MSFLPTFVSNFLIRQLNKKLNKKSCLFDPQFGHLKHKKVEKTRGGEFGTVLGENPFSRLLHATLNTPQKNSNLRAQSKNGR